MQPSAVRPDDARLKRRIVEFMRAASTEISVHDEPLLPALADTLSVGRTMYIAHTPKVTFAEVVRVAIKAQSLGLRASPHLVARSLTSEAVLRTGLAQLTDAGVEQVLLIAGDIKRPVGPFASTLEVLAAGALTAAGIRAIGVAGHPEGHPFIDSHQLHQALQFKQAFASRTGVKVHIVTQFGFNPPAVCTWAAQLSAAGITLPIHVGIAGPTPLAKLVKFSIQCGVGASLGALAKNVNLLTQLTGVAASPDEMLTGIVGQCVSSPTSTIAQPHFYAFGGAQATAAWMRAVMDGEFELHADGRKFILSKRT